MSDLEHAGSPQSTCEAGAPVIFAPGVAAAYLARWDFATTKTAPPAIGPGRAAGHIPAPADMRE